MKLDVIMNNAGAILTISFVGLVLTTIVLMTLPRLWLKEHWISTQNFFLTIAPYFIVTAIGFRNLALGTTGMLLAALLLGFVIGRK